MFTFFFFNKMSNCCYLEIFSTSQRCYSNSNIFYIFHCIFRRINTYNGNGYTSWSSTSDINSAHGGVIYFYQQLVSLSIFYCIFFKCSSTGVGGAIFYLCDINGSNSNISFTCVSSCWTISPNDCQFAFISTFNHINNDIKCNYLSINYLHKFYSNGINSILLYYGNQLYKSSNTSNNNILSCPLNYIAKPNNYLSNFCNFINNPISGYRSFVFMSNSNNLISKCNIINNSSPTQHGVVTILDYGYYTFENCIFIKNNDFLFYIFSGSINLFNCYVSHLNSKFSNIIIDKTNNIIFENSITQTFLFLHFSTVYCDELFKLTKIIQKNDFFQNFYLIFLII